MNLFIYMHWLIWLSAATSWRRKRERNYLQAFKKLLTGQKKVVFQETRPFWLLHCEVLERSRRWSTVTKSAEGTLSAFETALEHAIIIVRSLINSPTAYWAQPTASQGYSIQSLLAAVLHHSWTVLCTFGLHSHSTDCGWTTSSSAATSVGGALCYSMSCDSARKNDAWPTSSGSKWDYTVLARFCTNWLPTDSWTLCYNSVL